MSPSRTTAVPARGRAAVRRPVPPLHERWAWAARATGIRHPDDGFTAVAVRYTEPWRVYHDLLHLEQVTAEVYRLSTLADDPAATLLAAFFHDAVYRPGARGNERASAALAERTLRGYGVDTARRRRVVSLVLATAAHRPPAGLEADGAVLCDADLAVLARPPPDYDGYVDRVRREYRQVGAAAWRAGRAALLRALLARGRLYHTPPWREREARARANLRRELAGLGDHGASPG